jgi:predicted  nucleic acid-binding Zn-ribbon protein
VQAVDAEARANRRLTEANARVQALRVALLEANAAVQGAAEDFPELRHVTPARVTEVRHATLRITNDCVGLASATSGIDDLRMRAEELAERVQEAEDRLEEYTEDVRRTRGDATRLKGQLDTIERSLAGTDAATLRAQVAALSTRIHDARDELGKLQTRNGRNESDVTKAKAEVMRLRDALVEAEGRIHAATHEFEVRLKAYPEEAMRRALEIFDQAGGQGGPTAAAAELLKKRKLGAGLADNVEDRNKRAGNQLVQTFHAHKVELNKYRPEISEDNWVTLVMVSDGRRLNPGAFLQRLHVIEEEQRQVVSAAEHDLYVKFFLGDVLQHLRRRMLLATDFVSRVDDILKGMHLSNGARFRLTWTPKAEEGVGAVNYTDLVTFVQADPETVSPARLSAMMTAFQQRLETVRAEQKGQSKESYRERLAAEFDYRSWFEFRFFFKNANDPEVELKGRAIETLSGGERTAAQILPLLACLHARSLGARPDAPKLMGLDEAFAGTDAQNMEKMLSIFVDLEFSYILIGDKITGDSRVVPACATYNLLARGTVITPVLYLWDGTRRARMSEETLRRDAALRQANDLAAARSIAAVVGTVPQDETRESVEVLPLFTGSTA